MWGWLYNHVGKVAAVAGAVASAAVVVLVPSLAVGQVVVSAVSAGVGMVAGGVAYGLKSLYEYGVNVGEVKGAANAQPSQLVVQAQDRALNGQHKFKTDSDLKMEAALAKAIADQAQLKTENKELNKQLQQAQQQVTTATDQLTLLQQQLKTKTNELTDKTTECDQIKKEFEKIQKSNKSTLEILKVLQKQVEEDSLNVEKLKKQIKIQQPSDKSNPPASAKSTAPKRFAEDLGSKSDEDANDEDDFGNKDDDPLYSGM